MGSTNWATVCCRSFNSVNTDLNITAGVGSSELPDKPTLVSSCLSVAAISMKLVGGSVVLFQLRWNASFRVNNGHTNVVRVMFFFFFLLRSSRFSPTALEIGWVFVRFIERSSIFDVPRALPHVQLLTHALCYLMGSPGLRSCDRITALVFSSLVKH